MENDPMATETLSELELFHQFVGQRLAAGRADESVDAALDDFRQQHPQLADLRAKIRVAQEQSQRGESGPFDADETKRAVRDRLAEHGIREPS